jgi:hypothetical protein
MLLISIRATAAGAVVVRLHRNEHPQTAGKTQHGPPPSAGTLTSSRSSAAAAGTCSGRTSIHAPPGRSTLSPGAVAAGAGTAGTPASSHCTGGRCAAFRRR